MQYIFYTVLLCFVGLNCFEQHEQAVIQTTITEMTNDFPVPDDKLAVSGNQTAHVKRAYQGLYNQTVEIIGQIPGCTRVKVPGVRYSLRNDKFDNSFCAKEKDLLRYTLLAESLRSHIPDKQYGKKPTIVLTYPWKNFSIGTRFVHQPEQDLHNGFAVSYFDFKNKRLVSDVVPYQNGIQEKHKDSQEQRKLMVKLITDLVDRVARQDDGRQTIAYVWGGSSCNTLYEDKNFYQSDAGYEREGQNEPYSGFDCSSLIMKMAQIAGMNFPWKTSGVMEQALPALQKDEQIENGDLIWFAGHVMMITDVEKNELIQSRGYASGYGSVYKAKLPDVFADINTLDDLRKAYQAHQSLMMKDRNGKDYKKIESFKILKIVR
jgi:hypothetical protein